jgi:hypothetical protein
MAFCRSPYTTGEGMDAATLPENGRVGTASGDEVKCTRLYHGKSSLYVDTCDRNKWKPAVHELLSEVIQLFCM